MYYIMFVCIEAQHYDEHKQQQNGGDQRIPPVGADVGGHNQRIREGHLLLWERYGEEISDLLCST